MPLNVNDITDTFVSGEEPKEVYKKVIEDIGHHFINNAERLSANMIDIHAGMKIEIDIPVSGIVTIDTTNTEYVIKKK
ncbi:hypothetical protein AMS59_12635 [Lysinibacillus sp. FJAT-14745]|uniref:hypothetical protein n=1 Tax=Lysinibacillus sp. FJAT-14745 TaxID=1704289 RepID=UPI0006ABE210|nr:hypothetical protein [Lysinibacillus sp. FJAT-14745]KOP78658.1 hypothetical protein AMS59_12635 [Lysinibacillus sp. FJAT-14745]